MSVTPRELATTLMARQRSARDAAVERAEALRRAVDVAVRSALDEGLVRSAWLIGSLAWGTHGAGSDVDLVVEGVAPSELDAVWARLAQAIGDDLDLLRLEELSPTFHERVLDEGVRL